MEVLTVDTYYKVLENCTLEAFESLKLKDFYPKDGTKAVWDVSSLLITNGDGLPTLKDKEIFRKEYIKENMSIIFLTALERHCKDFEKKYSLKTSFFYKKCYESLMVKYTESELWNKPDFGYDIDAEPNILNFIWKMRIEIESRTKESKIEIQHYTLNDYYNHYVEKGRFGFIIFRTYKSSQFDELLKRLNETKKQYDYIFNKLNDSQRIEFKNDFCDQLQKLKTYQTESKNIEIIQILFLKINDEYNHYNRNSKLQIDEYKSAIIGNFKMIFNRENDNKTPNSFYYYNQIRNFVKDKNNYVKTNIDLKKHTKELVIFNGTLESILLETFTVFESAYKYNIDEVYIINSFNMSKFELIENLKSLKNFRQSINIEIQNREYSSSILLKNYGVTQFKNLKSFLNSDLCIDIDKSPLKSEFDEVLIELENSIDINEIQILMKSNFQPEIVQPEPEKIELENESIRENFNPNHFNKDCYDLFLYLVENYEKKGKIKYINIFEFMKKSIDKNKYSFRFTQETYRIFIKDKYDIDIINYKVAQFKYYDEEKPALNSFEQQFSQTKSKLI